MSEDRVETIIKGIGIAIMLAGWTWLGYITHCSMTAAIAGWLMCIGAIIYALADTI